MQALNMTQSRHDNAWQWFCFGEQWCLFLDFVIYASKLITNQKWLFISYNLYDFTANTKQTLFNYIQPCFSVEY